MLCEHFFTSFFRQFLKESKTFTEELLCDSHCSALGTPRHLVGPKPAMMAVGDANKLVRDWCLSSGKKRVDLGGTRPFSAHQNSQLCTRSRWVRILGVPSAGCRSQLEGGRHVQLGHRKQQKTCNTENKGPSNSSVHFKDGETEALRGYPKPRQVACRTGSGPQVS